MPDWQNLESSNLAAASYDETSQVLSIRFKSGRTYRYADVPTNVYQALLSASSPGQYFNSIIKDAYGLL